MSTDGDMADKRDGRRDYLLDICDFDQPSPSDPAVTSVYDFKGVVLREKHGGNTPEAHAPGGEGPAPLCRVDGNVTHGIEASGYKFKPPNTIPPGYYPECDSCLEVINRDG